jgi:hypothetical protein
MRLPLYVLFNTGAMLSTLITCQTLKDALSLRIVVGDYANRKIEREPVIAPLNEVLNTIDSQYPLIKLSNIPRDNSYMMYGLKTFLYESE